MIPFFLLVLAITFSRRYMSQGYMSQGVSVQGGKCPGGKCLGGICPGVSVRGVHVHGGLCPRTIEYIAFVIPINRPVIFAF